MKNSTPADRRKAQETIEAMLSETEAYTFSVKMWKSGDCTVTAEYTPVDAISAHGDNLDDAFINLLHKLAGTYYHQT